MEHDLFGKPASTFPDHALVPSWGKTGIHTALVLGQRRDRLIVLIVEPDIQRAKIGLLALAARRLRDRDDAVLVEQPFKRLVRGTGALLKADRGERFVGG